MAKISERKYSFQILLKLKMVTVIMPGCASGNMIFQKVFDWEQPSMAAASSYSPDRLEKNAIRKMVV